MGWVIAFAAIILLCFIPVGICLAHDSGKTRVNLSVGPIRIMPYPRKKSKKKDENGKDGGKGQKDDFETRDKKSNGTFSNYLSALQFVFEVLSDFRRKLRIKRLELNWILSGDDPCDLSINYGRVWAAVGNLMPQLDRIFVIKKRNIEIACDYTAQKDVLRAHLELTITLGRLLFVLVYHGIRGLRKYYKLMNQIKGGATI